MLRERLTSMLAQPALMCTNPALCSLRQSINALIGPRRFPRDILDASVNSNTMGNYAAYHHDLEVTYDYSSMFNSSRWTLADSSSESNMSCEEYVIRRGIAYSAYTSCLEGHPTKLQAVDEQRKIEPVNQIERSSTLTEEPKPSSPHRLLLRSPPPAADDGIMMVAVEEGVDNCCSLEHDCERSQ